MSSLNFFVKSNMVIRIEVMTKIELTCMARHTRAKFYYSTVNLQMNTTVIQQEMIMNTIN